MAYFPGLFVRVLDQVVAFAIPDEYTPWVKPKGKKRPEAEPEENLPPKPEKRGKTEPSRAFERTGEQIANQIYRYLLDVRVSPQDRARVAILVFGKALSIYYPEDVTKGLFKRALGWADQYGEGVDVTKFDPPKVDFYFQKEWNTAQEMADRLINYVLSFKGRHSAKDIDDGVCYSFLLVIRSIPREKRKNFLAWVREIWNRWKEGKRKNMGEDALSKSISLGCEALRFVLDKDAAIRNKRLAIISLYKGLLASVAPKVRETYLKTMPTMMSKTEKALKISASPEADLLSEGGEIPEEAKKLEREILLFIRSKDPRYVVRHHAMLQLYALLLVVGPRYGLWEGLEKEHVDLGDKAVYLFEDLLSFIEEGKEPIKTKCAAIMLLYEETIGKLPEKEREKVNASAAGLAEKGKELLQKEPYNKVIVIDTKNVMDGFDLAKKIAAFIKKRTEVPQIMTMMVALLHAWLFEMYPGITRRWVVGTIISKVYYHILNMDVTPRERACIAACVCGRMYSGLSEEEKSALVKEVLEAEKSIDRESLGKATMFDVPKSAEITADEGVRAYEAAIPVLNYVKSIKGATFMERVYGTLHTFTPIFNTIRKEQREDFLALVQAFARACNEIKPVKKYEF